MQFFDSATSLGTKNLSGGKATLATSSLSVGTHSITAKYTGDPNYNASTSAVLSQPCGASSSGTARRNSSDLDEAGATSRRENCLDFFDPSVYYVYITRRGASQSSAPDRRCHGINLLGGRSEAWVSGLARCRIQGLYGLRVKRPPSPPGARPGAGRWKRAQRNCFWNKANRSLKNQREFLKITQK